MLRFVSRLLGLGFLAAALLVLALDLWRWGFGAGWPWLRPLGQVWYALDPGSLNLIQAVIERYLLSFLWNPLLLTVLTWGAAPVFAVLGLLFLWLGRRRRR